MRSSAPYTRAILRGIRHRRGPNSTAPLSRVVNTNAKRLCLRRQPSLQPADILVDIPADILVDIPADILVDILSTSQTKTLKKEKVNIIKDLLY